MPEFADVTVADHWVTGRDRPAWLASINLAAARNFLASDPPRIAAGRISLMRMVESIAGGHELATCRQTKRAFGTKVSGEGVLTALARQAGEIAIALSRIADQTDHEDKNHLRRELVEIQSLIESLNQTIISILADRSIKATKATGSVSHEGPFQSPELGPQNCSSHKQPESLKFTKSRM
ncbi:hypothetical protein [Methylobacterium sp. CM6244]